MDRYLEKVSNELMTRIDTTISRKYAEVLDHGKPVIGSYDQYIFNCLAKYDAKQVDKFREVVNKSEEREDIERADIFEHNHHNIKNNAEWMKTYISDAKYNLTNWLTSETERLKSLICCMLIACDTSPMNALVLLKKSDNLIPEHLFDHKPADNDQWNATLVILMCSKLIQLTNIYHHLSNAMDALNSLNL